MWVIIGGKSFNLDKGVSIYKDKSMDSEHVFRIIMKTENRDLILLKNKDEDVIEKEFNRIINILQQQRRIK